MGSEFFANPTCQLSAKGSCKLSLLRTQWIFGLGKVIKIKRVDDLLKDIINDFFFSFFVKVSTPRSGKFLFLFFFKFGVFLYKEALFWKTRAYTHFSFLYFNSAWYDLLFHSAYMRKILSMGQPLKLAFLSVGTFGELQTVSPNCPRAGDFQ